MNKSIIKCEAYARGYYDARVKGVEDNEVAGENDEYRYFYDCGYESGENDYCYFELGHE